MKICLLGAPGCGKGTQAEIVSKFLNIPHISTGEIFRNAITNKTKLGVEIKELIESGNLVSDQITCDLVFDRIEEDDCKNGFILDGFPRTLNQAKIFDEKNKFDYVLYFNLKEDIIEQRIKSRRTCQKCGKIYSTQIDNIDCCTVCGGKLIIRKEDLNFEVRLKEYYRQTFPLIDYYKNKNLLKEIDVNQFLDEEPKVQISEIFNKIKEIIK